jgi:DNA-binding NarL/FixJ family response regulator
VVAIRADAPTRIFCFIDDLFFLAKIQETARKLGVKVEFVKGDKDSVARLIDLPEAERPKLVVFDLNNLNAKPMALIPKFKTKFKKATSIVGYLNHLQGELKAKAIEAGCDAVMPRSAFSQTLPNLLRRYGLDEEEDHTPQPV